VETTSAISKIGYPLGYPEPALQQKTEERDRENMRWNEMRQLCSVQFRWMLVDSGGTYSEWLEWSRRPPGNTALSLVDIAV